MNESGLAQQLLNLIGGKQNINQVWHCATLTARFQLKELEKVPKDKIEALDGVITVVEASGQFQVVIGNNVGDVYHEVVKLEPSLSEGETSGETAAQGKMTFKSAFNSLLIYAILGRDGRRRDFERLAIFGRGHGLVNSEKRRVSNLVGRSRWYFLFPANCLSIYRC